MELHYSEIEKDLRLLKLIGRLDITGVSVIETSFAAHCSGDTPRVIVDLSDVDFLASIGIRLLTLHAKSIGGRGGRMVLLKPGVDIRDVLEITGVSAIIPISDGLNAAKAVLVG